MGVCENILVAEWFVKRQNEIVHYRMICEPSGQTFIEVEGQDKLDLPSWKPRNTNQDLVCHHIAEALESHQFCMVTPSINLENFRDEITLFRAQLANEPTGKVEDHV